MLLVAAIAVFGLPLGEPLKLPECVKSTPPLSGYDANQPALCQEVYPPIGSDTTTAYFIIFPTTAVPEIASSGTMGARISDGTLVGVSLNTAGVEDQYRVVDLLTEKFGKPTQITKRQVSNLHGASFEAVRSFWRTPYAVVKFDSAPDRVDRGSVVIMTPEEARVVDAAEAERISKHTKL